MTAILNPSQRECSAYPPSCFGEGTAHLKATAQVPPNLLYTWHKLEFEDCLGDQNGQEIWKKKWTDTASHPR